MAIKRGILSVLPVLILASHYKLTEAEQLFFLFEDSGTSHV